MNAGIHEYLQSVKKTIKRSGDRRLDYYKGFEREVNSFLEDNPGANAADVEQYFGSPGAISADYLASLPETELQKKLCLRQRIFVVVSITVVALAIVIAVLAGIFVYDNYQFTHGETIYNQVSETYPVPKSDNYRTY